MDAWPIIALVGITGIAAILWLGWRDGWIGARWSADAALAGPRRRALRNANFVGVAEVARFTGMRRRLGYHAANRIMQALAARIRAQGHQIGRVGRDSIEFLFHAEGPTIARDLIAELKAVLEADLTIDAIAFEPEIAIGYNLIGIGRHYEELFDLAASAAEDARRQPDRIAFAEEHAHAAESTRSAVLIQDLYSAIRQDALDLHYMPKLDLSDNAIKGAEALCRWTHPEQGPIPPVTFIKLAEETGLIGDLTLWTLDRAIADQARLSAGHATALMIDVNLSAQLLGNDLFCGEVIARIAAAMGRIGLEITETAAIDDVEAALRNLHRFSDAGIHVAIDDFGAGLASLAYLRDLPAQELKIDQAFVRALTTSHRDPLLVRSAIDIAHALEMKITAEGVEDEMALALLKVMRCDHAQGYHIARPMPLDALARFLAERAARPAEEKTPAFPLRRLG